MEHIISLLLHYKYFILLPLAIVEGPIIAIIVGLLCTRGVMNPFYSYFIIVFGDLIGDTIVYLLGRYNLLLFLQKIRRRLGLTDVKLERARTFIEANPNKTISLSKILLGIGVAGIYMAGNVKVPYSRFIVICLITSATQYIIYIAIGLIFGQAYIQINHYLNYFATVTILIAVAVVAILFVKSKLSKL